MIESLSKLFLLLQRCRIDLALAVVAAATAYLLAGRPGTGLEVEGMEAARATAAVAALMAVLWMTQALPLPVTSLLPLILLPLAGVVPMKDAAKPYAHPVIFLFMGGFLLAQAVERWGLHRRIALYTVSAVGVRPSRLVGGFMLATAVLSMWISNAATVMLMLPIGLSILALLEQPRQTTPGESGRPPAQTPLATALLLGIAYAANIGGMATLVGTPPNIVLAGYLEETHGLQLGFARWMLMATPLVVVLLLLTWLLLTQVMFRSRIQELPGGESFLQAEISKLGRMQRGEVTVLIVFSLTALGWIFRTPLSQWEWLIARVPAVAQLNDTIIALCGAVALFVIPVDGRKGEFALDWQSARRLPWGILILFGGGLSLAAAVAGSGLGDWIGRQVADLERVSTLGLIFAVSVTVIFLTEVTSNTATATTFLPILGGVAVGLGVDVYLLLIPATLAASCAFMLPVATPPNAIVFGSEQLAVRDMMKAGWWLNWIAAALIPLLTWTLVGWLFVGAEINVP